MATDKKPSKTNCENTKMNVEQAIKRKQKIKDSQSFHIFLVVMPGIAAFATFMASFSLESPAILLFLLSLSFFIFALVMLFWLISDFEKIEALNKIIARGKQVPAELTGFNKVLYEDAQALLIKAGFINIKCVPLKDLSGRKLKKQNFVSYIEVGNTSHFSSEDKFDADAPVVVFYHSPK